MFTEGWCTKMEKTESDPSWLEVFLIELIYNILNQSCGNFLIASTVHALEMAVLVYSCTTGGP